MYDISHQPEAMQARYKYLPPSIIELFEYGTVELIVEETGKEFGLNEDQKAGLLMEIELILYFFMTRNGFVERLKESLEIDQVRATQIAAKVESDLFVIVDGILDVAEAEFASQEAEEVPEQQSPVVSNVDETLPPPPAPVTLVKPIRTFADDVNLNQAHSYGAFRTQNDDEDEPVHSSNQDDIIK